MKLGLITPGFSADERDWCIPWLLNLTRALAQQHEVHVFTLRYPHRQSTYRVHGALVHAFGGATVGGLRRLPLLLCARAAILGEHRLQPFDLLHGLWADEPGFLAATTARAIGIPAIVSILGGELVGFPDIAYGGQLSRANRWLTARALAAADRVTVGSGFLFEMALASVGSGATDRLTLWPVGVDTAMFRTEGERRRMPRSGETETFHLLQVAALSPVKDQATLLRALAQVVPQVPRVHLHLVGQGPLRGVLADQARMLGLDAYVTFHGEVPHDRLPDFYRAVDLFVLSSRFESQSLVVLEAAACGCPIVGTAVGILPDLLPSAALAAPGDSEGLAHVILSVVNQAPSAEWRREGVETTPLPRYAARVAQDFSLESSLAALSALYHDPKR